MNLKGQTVTVKRSAKYIYAFFTNPENYKQLMPKGTEKFEIEDQSFSFKLKSMPELKMLIKQKIEYSKVVLSSTADARFVFSLTSNIKEESKNKTQVYLNFESNLNPMMTMMVKKPLSKFIETLTENISNL
ncbi:MAG: SRPBCC family protein [Tenacibaculum sp.]